MLWDPCGEVKESKIILYLLSSFHPVHWKKTPKFVGKAHDQSSSFIYRQEDQFRRLWINLYSPICVCTEPCKPIKGFFFFLYLAFYIYIFNPCIQTKRCLDSKHSYFLPLDFNWLLMDLFFVTWPVLFLSQLEVTFLILTSVTWSCNIPVTDTSLNNRPKIQRK